MLLILRQGGQRCQGFNFIGTAIMSITIFTSRSVSAFISKRFPSSSQNRSICAKDPKFPNLTLSQESFCDRIEWETVVLQSQYLQKLSLKSRGFSLFLDKKKKYFCHLYLQSRTFGKRIAKALQLEYENVYKRVKLCKLFTSANIIGRLESLYHILQWFKTLNPVIKHLVLIQVEVEQPTVQDLLPEESGSEEITFSSKPAAQCEISPGWERGPTVGGLAGLKSQEGSPGVGLPPTCIL